MNTLSHPQREFIHKDKLYYIQTLPFSANGKLHCVTDDKALGIYWLNINDWGHICAGVDPNKLQELTPYVVDFLNYRSECFRRGRR